MLVPGLVLLLAAACAPGAAVAAPAEANLGAAFLFQLDRVTVVYPAGPGEDVETNRAAALARARFLRQSHGVDATVAADDSLTEEQRSGHLLLLGWNNRVLGTEAVPRPFVHADGTVRFLGIDLPDRGVDILFLTRSPFRKDSALAFWSRIDPDRDRMVVLPAIGSDWAILRDYRALCQGMFAVPPSWPPVRDPDAERDHRLDLEALAARDRVLDRERYRIVYDGGAVTDTDLEAIVKAREAALGAAETALGDAPPGFRITLFVYADENAKKERTGLAEEAHSLPGTREIHMTARAARNASPHEELHVLARATLGKCFLTTMYEGLAISEDRVLRGLDLDLHAASMIPRGAFPRLDDLLDEEGARALPELARFAGAGLLVSWIREAGGRAALARAYGLPADARAGSLAQAMGLPADAVEPAFRRWVDARVKARNADVVFLAAQSEAAERYRAGDYAGVAAAMKSALKAKPDDPQTLFNLASAEMRIQAYSDAEGRLRHLLSLPDKPPHFAAFGHYQLGRLLDIEGRREEALEEYRKVLELPDVRDSHRLANERLATPATADQLE